MATTVEIENVKIESSVDQLKAIISEIAEQQSMSKNLMATVRAVLKTVEKQSKELDKFHNKKSKGSAERKASAQPSGITKPVSISDDLAKFLGVEPGTLVPRNEVTKGVSAYVRLHELFDPTNKQNFVLTEKPEGIILANLLGNPDVKVTYFNLQRHLKHHYLPMAPVEKPAKVPKTPKAAAPVEVSTPVEAAPAKKVSKPKAKAAEVEVAPPAPVEAEPVKKKKTVVVKKKASELSEDA